MAQNLPAIPQPSRTNPQPALQALKEAVEILARQRGRVLDSAVTFQDLIDMGVITPDQVPLRR